MTLIPTEKKTLMLNGTHRSYHTIGATLKDTPDEEFRELYGRDIRIYRCCYLVDTAMVCYVLIMPGDWTKKKADTEFCLFDPDDHFEDDCPLCSALRKSGGTVVY